MSARRFGAATLACMAWVIAAAAAPTVVGAAEPGPLAAAGSWVYQLQGDMTWTVRSDADVAVVDWDHVRTHETLASLQRKPGNTRRSVLGYLSIGEAEDSRVYWKACCTEGRQPAWLTEQTQGWPGNFAVRYWDADWQNLVRNRLRQIIEAGFDGVYLDRADVWEMMQPARAGARSDMVKFVVELAALAHATKPGFAVIMQNAEELLSDPTYLAAIDGIAKEDLLHGVNHDGLRNPADMIAHSVGMLQLVRAQRKPVFVVEYLPEGGDADRVRAEIVGHGFVPFIADRDLADVRPEAAPGSILQPADKPAPLR